jgi:hypothetical protein
MRKTMIAGVVTLAVLTGCGTTGDTGDNLNHPKATATACPSGQWVLPSTGKCGVPLTDPAVNAAATEGADDVPLPAPADFTLRVKVTSKQCFGSAGCNIEYEVQPTFNSGEWSYPNDVDVTFAVTGGEDGPIIGTFTISPDGNMDTADLTGFASTSRRSIVLKAKVTEVAEA